MQANPAVSVVVAAFNMGLYIQAAVNSVLQQTCDDLEVIVVDDGSKDNTAEVMSQFAGNARVRYIQQQNQGQPRAKNCGIRAARGRFIAFCDADDIWVPDKLARQLPLFDQDPAIGVVYGQTATIDPQGVRTGEVSTHGPSGAVLQQLFIKNFVPFGTAVVRREVIDSIGMFDESLAMGIDWDLWLRTATRWQFGYIAEPVYLYRVWPGQMSRNWLGRYEHAFRIMEKFLASYPSLLPPRIVRRAYADSFVGRGICYETIAGERRRACTDYLTALKIDPTYLTAWLQLVKLAVPRGAPQSSR